MDLSGRPPFEEMTFSPDYTNISMPDSRTWNVTYEYSTDTTFTGVVRHVSLWYDPAAAERASVRRFLTKGQLDDKGTSHS